MECLCFQTNVITKKEGQDLIHQKINEEKEYFLQQSIVHIKEILTSYMQMRECIVDEVAENMVYFGDKLMVNGVGSGFHPEYDDVHPEYDEVNNIATLCTDTLVNNCFIYQNGEEKDNYIEDVEYLFTKGNFTFSECNLKLDIENVENNVKNFILKNFKSYFSLATSFVMKSNCTITMLEIISIIREVICNLTYDKYTPCGLFFLGLQHFVYV